MNLMGRQTHPAGGGFQETQEKVVDLILPSVGLDKRVCRTVWTDSGGGTRDRKLSRNSWT